MTKAFEIDSVDIEDVLARLPGRIEMTHTHDEYPGAEPEQPVKEDEFEGSIALREARRRALDREGWIADEFAFFDREIQKLKAIKRPKGRQPTIFLQTPTDVLDAVKLGVMDKNEARVLLGLKKRRQPAGLRRKVTK